MADATDAELLARWRAGLDGAGQELCERHRGLVARIVGAHRPRSCSFDDLVQEVFMTMFARSERYEARDDTPFAHWLSRLAMNVCRDALRADTRRVTGDPLSSEAAETLAWLHSGAEDARHEADAARELVERLFSTLRPADRLVLTLLDIEGRSVAEIAALSGWSRTLVKVRAFRARRALRASVGRLRKDLR